MRIAHEKIRAAAWGVLFSGILAFLIVIGSRNLDHFDAALATGTEGTEATGTEGTEVTGTEPTEVTGIKQRETEERRARRGRERFDGVGRRSRPGGLSNTICVKRVACDGARLVLTRIVLLSPAASRRAVESRRRLRCSVSLCLYPLSP